MAKKKRIKYKANPVYSERYVIDECPYNRRTSSDYLHTEIYNVYSGKIVARPYTDSQVKNALRYWNSK